MAEQKTRPMVNTSGYITMGGLTEKEREQIQNSGRDPDNYIVAKRTKHIVFVKSIGFEKNHLFIDPLCGRKGGE